MKYILDTNVISYALKDPSSNVFQNLRRTPASMIQIPTIVMAELEFGAQNGGKYEQTMCTIKRFTDAFEKISFSEEAAIQYGKIRLDLKKKGTPIGANDMLIAAIALADNAVLITHNTKEFERVSGLMIQDWTLDFNIPD